MSTENERESLSAEELEAQGVTPLPDKEVASILDLNADLDIALDVAAPIDLAVAANANVAAPIDAAVGANILSAGSSAQALADQGVVIEQGIDADATATSTQDSAIDQGTSDDGASTDPAATADPTDASVPVDGGTIPDDLGSALDGNLLNVDVDLAADADLAAPINGAVAANANVAAPIDAAVAANIGSIDSEAVSIAQQDAIITQNIEGEATATADQQSDLQQ